MTKSTLERSSHRAGITAIAAIAMSLTACADDRDGWVLASAPSAPSPLDAAVQVRVGGCSLIDHLGQGSMIGARLVLTSAHVVAGATAIGLTAADGTTASGVVVHLDPDLDLALVETDRPIGRPLVIGRAGRGDVGTVVVRRDERLTVMQVGVVRPVTIRTEDIYIDGMVERPGYELEATIESGDSGGVVVVDGRAVAVVWSRSRQDPSRAWAIDPNAITDAVSGNIRSVPADTHCA
jgi:S1-C subfamily serine protease